VQLRHDVHRRVFAKTYTLSTISTTQTLVTAGTITVTGERIRDKIAASKRKGCKCFSKRYGSAARVRKAKVKKK